MRRQIYCIHHVDNRERKPPLLAKFATQGLDVEWIETYHPSQREHWDHDGLSGNSVGETSCALKHRDALRRQIAQEIPVSILLEDDIDLPDSFAEDLKGYLDEFQELEGDVLMIGTGFDMHMPVTDPSRSVYLAPEGYGRATHAWGATLAAARVIEPALRHMPKGIGHDLNDIVRGDGLRMCWVEPGLEQLTMTGHMLSSIGERRRLRDRVRVASRRVTAFGSRR